MTKITEAAHDAINSLIVEMRKFENDESRAHVFEVLDAFFCRCGRERVGDNSDHYCRDK